MTTTIDLPDDLAREVQSRADRGGRALSAEVVELLRRGLADAERAGGAGACPVITTDPETGLPVIQSPPDAPIHRMTGDEFQALVDRAQREADLERLGVPVRR